MGFTTWPSPKPTASAAGPSSTCSATTPRPTGRAGGGPRTCTPTITPCSAPRPSGWWPRSRGWSCARPPREGGRCRSGRVSRIRRARSSTRARPRARGGATFPSPGSSRGCRRTNGTTIRRSRRSAFDSSSPPTVARSFVCRSTATGRASTRRSGTPRDSRTWKRSGRRPPRNARADEGRRRGSTTTGNSSGMPTRGSRCIARRPSGRRAGAFCSTPRSTTSSRGARPRPWREAPTTDGRWNCVRDCTT
mmetsp:Transcript_48047/g.102187  ORF Transcript_48047/g.102187 Transcript_48047/m.102187 type:complete len:249 (+) Transcript_48047:56-802(+)